jgi:hypothetical protein
MTGHRGGDVVDVFVTNWGPTGPFSTATAPPAMGIFRDVVNGLPVGIAYPVGHVPSRKAPATVFRLEAEVVDPEARRVCVGRRFVELGDAARRNRRTGRPDIARPTPLMIASTLTRLDAGLSTARCADAQQFFRGSHVSGRRPRHVRLTSRSRYFVGAVTVPRSHQQVTLRVSGYYRHTTG